MTKITIFFIAAIIMESVQSTSSVKMSSASFENEDDTSPKTPKIHSYEANESLICSESDDDTPPSTPKVHSNEASESLKPNENLRYDSTYKPGINYPGFGTNMIELKNPSIINHIEISYWNRDMVDLLKRFSYYIDVSMDRVNWTRVIDHSNYNCRAIQDLWIPPRLVQYIHIVGTNSTAGATFKIWDISYDSKRVNQVKIKNGLIVPSYGLNVASKSMAALVSDGLNCGKSNGLIRAYYKGKDRHDLYTFHEIVESESIVVHLAQPYILNSMRLLLWGSEKQAYSYTIESSVNGEEWVMVVDKSNELAQSWQVLKFKAMPMLYIRITGVFSSTDRYFRCIYLEAPAQIKLDTNVVEEDYRAETSPQNATV